MNVTAGSVVPLLGAGGGPRARDEDAGGEQERGARRDTQPGPRIADARPAGPLQEERGCRLDGHEVPDHDRGRQDVAPGSDRDDQHGHHEPRQAGGRHAPRDRHEVARQPERQVRLQQEDDRGQRRDPARQGRPQRERDGDREQRDHGPEDEHEIAMDRPRLPQVARQDHDEDEDEGQLECDVDSVHESLGTYATRLSMVRAGSTSRGDVRPDRRYRALAHHAPCAGDAECYNGISIGPPFDGIGPCRDGGVAVAGAGLASRRSEARDGSDLHHGSNLLLRARGADRRQQRRLFRRLPLDRPDRTATSPPIAASWPSSAQGSAARDDRLAVRPGSVALADAVTAWAAVNGAAALEWRRSAAAVTAARSPHEASQGDLSGRADPHQGRAARRAPDPRPRWSARTSSRST